MDNIEVDISGQMSMQFTARIPDEGKRIYIIDEASMLSGDASKELLFARFGSGVLLNDFFEVIGSNKVIFVGDPCQLPPINQSVSPALDTGWLRSQNRVAVSFTLEKIERVDESNDILKLAGAVRNMSQQKTWELYPKLPASGLNNVKLYLSDKALFNRYLKCYKQNGVNDAIAIARSNRMVNNINKAVRREFYGPSPENLYVGEVLLVTQNNYSIPLANGDFVTVTEIGDIKSRSGLHFLGIKVRPVSLEKEYDILLSLETLYSVKGTLNSQQMERLMIDFSQRMRTKNISANTSDYKKAMLEDEYLNCLKATYGYGVTCHKAQGGEWNNVFLFLDNEKNGMYNMPPVVLCKWWYTVITRARQELHLVKHWWVT